MMQARESDIPAILELLEECHAASVYSDIAFDRNYSESLLRRLMESAEALVLTTGQGVFIAVLSPLHFSPQKQALELAFWGRGGREMIRAAQDWAKERGAVRFVSANENNARSDAMDRWYRGEGMNAQSVSYARSL